MSDRPLKSMARPTLALGLTGLTLLVAGGMVVLCPPVPVGTADPSEARLGAFVRLMPIAFRPAIAAQERKAGGLRPRAVPVAVGLASGARVRIVFPADLRGGHYDVDQAQVLRDVYTAPPTPFGHAVETAFYSYTNRTRDVHFVASGESSVAAKQPGRTIDGRVYDEKLADGASTLRDLGPLAAGGGGYVLRAPGASGDGVGIVPVNGGTPRLVALAPAELPPSTPAEPGGYALLFDTATLWRQRDSTQAMASVSYRGLGSYLPRSWRLGVVQYTSTLRTYHVSALAHVYVREGGRWRYARTWRLQGSGDAWFTDNEPEFTRAHPGGAGGTTGFGVPDVLKASRIVEFVP